MNNHLSNSLPLGFFSKKQGSKDVSEEGSFEKTFDPKKVGKINIVQFEIATNQSVAEEPSSQRSSMFSVSRRQPTIKKVSEKFLNDLKASTSESTSTGTHIFFESLSKTRRCY